MDFIDSNNDIYNNVLVYKINELNQIEYIKKIDSIVRNDFIPVKEELNPSSTYFLITSMLQKVRICKIIPEFESSTWLIQEILETHKKLPNNCETLDLIVFRISRSNIDSFLFSRQWNSVIVFDFVETDFKLS